MKKSVLFFVVCLFAASLVHAQSVTIISPNGGEAWAMGSTQMIRWQFAGGAFQPVKIILSKDGQLVCTIAGKAPCDKYGAGSFQWQVGYVPNPNPYVVGQPTKCAGPGKGYRIEIKTLDFMLSDGSDNPFMII
jgi:hypothetical protein